MQFSDIDKAEQLEFFSTLAEDSSYGIIAINDKQQILWSNRLVSKCTDYSEFELMGKDINELVVSSFRERHSKILTKWFKSPKFIELSKRKPLTFVKANGDVLSTEITIRPYNKYEHGKKIKFDQPNHPQIIGICEIKFI